jgi:hypothetical protein
MRNIPTLLTGKQYELKRGPNYGCQFLICFIHQVFRISRKLQGRSQWSLGLRHELFSLVRTLDAGIVDSYPTQGMDVCVPLFCVCVLLCLGSGLATG